MKIKKSLKIFATLMAILTLIMSLPIYAFANEVKTLFNNYEEKSSSEDPIATNKEIFVLEEKEEFRDENVKHYLLSDGTSKAVVYNEAVHYLDKDGKWQDFDNALVLSGNEYEAKSKFEIKFANKSNGNKLLSIKDGKYKIDFSPLDTNKVNVEIINPQKENSRKFDDIVSLKGKVSKAIYKDIYNGTDIEYILFGNNIKENIIVKERASEYKFYFEIKVNGLKAELYNGYISFTDSKTNEEKYKIPAPYMYDANDKYSEAVSYSLEENKNGKYILSVIADASWINDSSTSFPVTIDPTVRTDRSYIVDTYISSDKRDASSDIGMFIGNWQFLDSAEAYIKFPLPTLPVNAVITKAELSLYKDWSSNIPFKIGSYMVNASWEPSIINAVSTSQYMSDYTTVNVSTAEVLSWDITRFVHLWNNGTPNNGICLKPAESIGSMTFASINSSERTDYPGPMIDITYRSAKGIEDYYSYYSSDAGMAGSGYINSFTGELTFIHDIFTTADEIMPYGLSYVYNSSSGTWMLSANESLVKDTSGDIIYFKWTDSDGTEHYFSPMLEKNIWGDFIYYEYDTSGNKVSTMNPTTFYDEDGLGLKIGTDTDSGKYIMSDDAGNKKIFSAINGYVEKIVDLHGNERIFTRNASDRLTNISLKPSGVTNAINQITITYQGTNISRIKNEQSKISADFTYTNGKISSIKYNYPTNKTYTVNYTYSGNLLTLAKDNETKKGIEYVFTNNKVTQITEHAYTTDSVLNGQSIKIAYEYGKTVCRSAGTDNILSNSDDILTVYKFDNNGRCVSAYSTDVSGGQIYGVSEVAYVSEEDENYTNRKVNSIKSVLQTSSNSVNLLPNGTFEHGMSKWTASNSSTNADYGFVGQSVMYNSDENIYCNRCARIVGLGINTESKLTSSLYLEAGTYTFSSSLLTKDMKNDSCAKLHVYRGNTLVDSSSSVYASIGDDTWVREFVTFDVASAGTYNFVISLKSPSNEYLYVDNAMVQKSVGMGTFSEYNNGDFEQALPNSLNLTLSNASISTDMSVSGDNSIKLSSSFSGKSSVKYSYDFSDGYEEQKLVLSFWANVSDAITTGENKNGVTNLPFFGVKIDYVFAANSTGGAYIPVSVKGDGWQYYSVYLNLWTYPRELKSMNISICYDYNQGNAYIDMASLHKTAQYFEYVYNDKGYITSVKDSNGNTVNYVYEENGYTVEKIVDQYGNELTYTYNNANDPVKTTVTKNYTVQDPSYSTETNYQYNSLGQVISTTVSNNQSSYVITSTKTYNTNTGSSSYSKISSYTDERNNKTSYFYYSNGLLKGICLNNDIGILYVYNEYGELEQITEAKYNSSLGTIEALSSTDTPSNVQYEYNSKHEMSSISTGNKEYTFSYDDYGNTESVSVGTTSLVSYEYAEGNGHIEKITYGNGTVVTYLYDKLDRVEKVLYNNSEKVKYSYSTDGQLTRAEDTVNGTVANYYYDANGNCVLKSIEKNSERIYSVMYIYNENNRLQTKYIYYPNSAAENEDNWIEYCYDEDGSLIGYVYNSLSGGYTKDPFDRVSTEYVDYIDFGNITYTYSYKNNNNKTSALIENVKTEIANSEKNTSYTYDSKGNILSITYSDTNKHIYYKYDSKDQLIREDNEPLGYTFVYDYDNNGNILNIHVYWYTTSSSLGSPLDTEIFGYGNNTWGDLLTSYKGGSITYDSIGNPLSYYNGISYKYFTWSNGRQLTSISGAVTATYKYNYDNIREEKVVNGKRHVYTLDGTSIVRECVYNASTNEILYEIRYIYDLNGAPVYARVMQYSLGSIYADDNLIFEKNLQGDIIAIYSEDGIKIVSFNYNAWGTFITTEHTTEQALIDMARLTSFRYRGYYYDSETGFYYLNTRYYDPQICRFINADGQLNDGLLGYNQFTYCENNPINYSDPYGQNPSEALAGWTTGAWWLTLTDGPLPIGDIIYWGGAAILGIIALATIDTQVKEQDKANVSVDSKTNDKDSGKTYYHVTTVEGAQAIMAAGVLIGSPWEGGYVFVFGCKPTRYAIKNSGAHGNVVIAFETKAAFEKDNGIKNSKIIGLMPLRSVFPFPVKISNVRIVEYV